MLKSEIFLYGFMVLNVLAVGAALLFAYRRGHFADVEGAADVLLPEIEEREGSGNAD